MIYLIESEFKLNWGSLVSLVVGMGLGIVLFVLIYALVTLKAVKKSTYTVTSIIKDVDEQEVLNEISEAKKEFLIRKDEESQISWNNIRDTSYNLIKTIAKKFYPDSKEPLGELTIEELILLDKYIVGKIEELLDKRMIKPAKYFSVNKILGIINAKSKVDNNAVVKTVKKSGINKIFSSAYAAINIINPATWAKKLIVNPTINLITKHICLDLFEVIGKETYHVYSKQAFLDPVKDEELDKLLEDLANDMSPVEKIKAKIEENKQEK